MEEENPAYKMQGDSGSFVKNWFVNADGKRNPDYFSIDDRVGALLKAGCAVLDPDGPRLAESALCFVHDCQAIPCADVAETHQAG